MLPFVNPSGVLEAVEDAFGADVNYAMLVKLYGQEPEAEKRYSPAKCIGAEKQVIQGNPDAKDISTSYVGCQNLTMRMSMRRFTRLTNAFSKNIKNLEYAIALHFMYYNFARPHKALANPYPRTPAMTAGLTNHIWTIEEIVNLKIERLSTIVLFSGCNLNSSVWFFMKDINFLSTSPRPFTYYSFWRACLKCKNIHFLVTNKRSSSVCNTDP